MLSFETANLLYTGLAIVFTVMIVVIGINAFQGE